MDQKRIESLLARLREHAQERGDGRLGSHEVNAHWTLAYACHQPPTTWEIYRSPGLYVMPTTKFFDEHRNEIEECIKPKATWELLRDHAVPKLALDAAMTDEECKTHGRPDNLQFYDPKSKAWTSVDVRPVKWFDARDAIRESLLETKADFEAKVAKNLARYKEAAKKYPSPRLFEQLLGYEKFISDSLPGRLRSFTKQKAEGRRWLRKLEKTPDLAKNIFTLIREAENEVRAARGIAAVGEGWISETELLYRVRELLPKIDVLAHGKPKWLGRQHLDVWIPSMNVGIEYHGVQHFRPVEFFGGEEAFRRVQERDQRKRKLCSENGVRLIEIIYDQDLDDESLRSLLIGEDGRK
jgi:hypothetical protein